jgi:hypothetical protein
VGEGGAKNDRRRGDEKGEFGRRKRYVVSGGRQGVRLIEVSIIICPLVLLMKGYLNFVLNI